MTVIPKKTKKIGIFSLANAADPEKVAVGVENFEKYTGMEILPYSVTPPGPRRFAGDDTLRAENFNALLAVPEVSGLVAIRGGYGVTRILEKIDFEALQRKDCFLCGYSDITALLLVAWKYGCHKLIHGPMIQSNWSADSTSSAFKIEAESFLQAQKSISDTSEYVLQDFTQGTSKHVLPRILKSASPLYPMPCPFLPMNLTLLCALLGTKFLPDLTGTILALEDISEPAHDIDRKLNQLRQVGILQRLAGLIFGQFTEAEDNEYLPQIFREYAEFVPGPVIENFPFGHCHPSIALPFGTRAKITISSNNTPNLTLSQN